MGSAAVLLGVFLAMGVGPLVGEAAAMPAAAEPAGLPGIYECEGTGADGRPYRGAVSIESDGDRFLVRWMIGAQLTAIGVGIREGDMLAVGFFSADTGGIVLYRIDGEHLIGHWSAPLADGQVFNETLTRVANPPSPSATPSAPPAARPHPSPPRPFGAARPVRWLEQP